MAGTAQRNRAGRDAGGGSSGSSDSRGDRPIRCHTVRGAVPRRGKFIPVNMRDAAEIERAVAAFARSSNGGLIVTAGAAAIVGRQLIPALAAKHKLPAVIPLATSSPAVA